MISDFKYWARNNLSENNIDTLKYMATSFHFIVAPLAALLARKKNVGKSSFLDPTAQILGWDNIRIGNNCIISEHTCLNVNSRIDGQFAIEIGDNCFIGRRNFFSSGRKILIGDYCLTGADCKFLGAGHVADPSKPYINSGTTDTDSINVGVNCWIGVGAIIIGDITIGHGSIIGAGTVLLHSLPPFSIAVGSPARIVKRFSFLSNTWITADDFSEELEALMPNEQDYLKYLTDENHSISMPKVAAGKSRGDIA